MLSAKLLESIPQSIRIIRKFSTQSLGGMLTLQQFRVLKLIQDGHGQTEMADLLDVSVAAVSKMTTSLLNQDLISRKAGSDKRTQILKLTAKGKSTLIKVRKFVEKKLDLGIDGLSLKEKDVLLEGLHVLNKLMHTMKEV